MLRQPGSIDWTKLRRYRWIPIFSAFVAVLYVWIQIMIRPRGDFPRHVELGGRLAKGVFIYKDSLDFVYPPFWALVHAPLSFLGAHAAQIIVYPFGVAGIAVLVATLARLSRESMPLPRDAAFWSTTLAILLSSLFLLRDLPEVAVNTALVAMSWLSIYLWTKNRDIAGGTLLGLASALKCTPLLFVAWFVLKRQWKIAAAAITALALFTLSPVLVTGTARYERLMKFWATGVVRGLSNPDPSRGPLGPDKVENLALRPALARYLMHYPYGYMSRPETSDTAGRPNAPPSPYYIQFLNLPAFWAGIVVRLIMAILFLAMVWLMRKKPVSRASPDLLWECAAVSILILLFSPITWVQHGVGVLPGIYLICRASFSGHRLSRLQTAAMGYFVIFCFLMSRFFFGRNFIKLANSYRVKTVGFLMLLSVVMSLRHARLPAQTKTSEGLETQGGRTPQG